METSDCGILGAFRAVGGSEFADCVFVGDEDRIIGKGGTGAVVLFSVDAGGAASDGVDGYDGCFGIRRKAEEAGGEAVDGKQSHHCALKVSGSFERRLTYIIM